MVLLNLVKRLSAVLIVVKSLFRNMTTVRAVDKRWTAAVQTEIAGLLPIKLLVPVFIVFFPMLDWGKN